MANLESSSSLSNIFLKNFCDKYIFKVDRKIGTKYQHSPYYKGTLLWNELNVGTQFARDVMIFKQFVGMKYKTHEKLI